MPTKPDLAFSEFLTKNDMLSAEVLERALEVVDKVLALGLRVPLARVLREQGTLDGAKIARVLELPMSDRKRELLAEQLRWLKVPPPQEPRVAELALQCGLVGLVDLEEARALATKVQELRVDKRPLEILIEKGKLLPEVAVALFDALRAPAAAVFTRADSAFCTTATSSRAVAPQDLQAAISLQRRLCARTRIGRPVAEILLATGKIKPETARTITDVVRSQCPDEPAHRVEAVITTRQQDRHIAELVQRGWIPLLQVDESRRVHEVMKELGLERKLGEVMVARGIIALDQLEALATAAKTSDGPPPLPEGAITMEPLPDDAGEEATMMEPLPDDEMLQADPPSGIIRGRPAGASAPRKPRRGRLPRRRGPGRA